MNEKAVFSEMPAEFQSKAQIAAVAVHDLMEKLGAEIKAMPGDQSNRENHALSAQAHALAFGTLTTLAHLMNEHPDKPMIMLMDAMLADIRNRMLIGYQQAVRVVQQGGLQ